MGIFSNYKFFNELSVKDGDNDTVLDDTDDAPVDYAADANGAGDDNNTPAGADDNDNDTDYAEGDDTQTDDNTEDTQPADDNEIPDDDEDEDYSIDEDNPNVDDDEDNDYSTDEDTPAGSDDDPESDTDYSDGNNNTEDQPEDGDDTQTDDTEGEDNQDNDGPATEAPGDDSGDDSTDYSDGEDDDGPATEAPDDTGDDSKSNNQDGDNESDDNSDEDRLKKMEAELFSDLTSKQISIRTKELKTQFLELYNLVNDTIRRIVDIPKINNNIYLTDFISGKLVEIKGLINDHIISTFDTKTYVENSIILQQYMVTIKYINLMIDEMNAKNAQDNA